MSSADKTGPTAAPEAPEADHTGRASRAEREAHHEALYAAWLVDLRSSDPRVTILHKGESRFCRVLDRALRILTFGKQDRFLTSYTTTLGRRIYVPDDWERYPAGDRLCILRHELIHVRQFRRLTFPGMALVYLFLPLPMGFAAGRAWLEWQGYRETLAATWQVFGRAAAHDPELHADIVKRFTGPDYAWMWISRRSVERAIQRELARLDRVPPAPL